MSEPVDSRLLNAFVHLLLHFYVQMIVCLCDAFSRPPYSPPVRHSSPAFTRKVAIGASVDELGAGDVDPDVEPSDADVCFLRLCLGSYIV